MQCFWYWSKPACTEALDYLAPRTRGRLQPAQSRFKDGLKAARASDDSLEVEKLETFKKNVGSFVRAYDFLSQIINYSDTELEKRSMFLRLLQRVVGLHSGAD